jgi:hypothetical protein
MPTATSSTSRCVSKVKNREPRLQCAIASWSAGGFGEAVEFDPKPFERALDTNYREVVVDLQERSDGGAEASPHDSGQR